MPLRKQHTLAIEELHRAQKIELLLDGAKQQEWGNTVAIANVTKSEQ